MESSLLLDIFLTIMIVSAIVVAAAIAFVAYHVYIILRKVETAGEHLMKGLSVFEESIKKLSFFKKSERTKRKAKRTEAKE